MMTGIKFQSNLEAAIKRLNAVFTTELKKRGVPIQQRELTLRAQRALSDFIQQKRNSQTPDANHRAQFCQEILQKYVEGTLQTMLCGQKNGQKQSIYANPALYKQLITALSQPMVATVVPFKQASTATGVRGNGKQVQTPDSAVAAKVIKLEQVREARMRQAVSLLAAKESDQRFDKLLADAQKELAAISQLLAQTPLETRKDKPPLTTSYHQRHPGSELSNGKNVQLVTKRSCLRPTPTLH